MCAVCEFSVDTYVGGAVELLRILHRGIPTRHGGSTAVGEGISVLSWSVFPHRVHIGECCNCCVLFRLFIFWYSTVLVSYCDTPSTMCFSVSNSCDVAFCISFWDVLFAPHILNHEHVWQSSRELWWYLMLLSAVFSGIDWSDSYKNTYQVCMYFLVVMFYVRLCFSCFDTCR